MSVRTVTPEDLRATFVRALDLDPSADVSELTYQAVPTWDSIGHLALVAAIEDDFDVELDVEQTLALNSFQSALRIIAELQDR